MLNWFFGLFRSSAAPLSPAAEALLLLLEEQGGGLSEFDPLHDQHLDEIRELERAGLVLHGTWNEMDVRLTRKGEIAAEEVRSRPVAITPAEAA